MNQNCRGNAKVLGAAVLAMVVSMVVGCSDLAPVEQAQTAEKLQRSSNNMKQIALALHSYHDKYGSFPPAYTVDESGQPLHSWRVLILPQLEMGMIYERFKLDEPWDSPENMAAAETMPQSYASPLLEGADVADRTPYVAIAGPNTVISTESPKAFRDITAGSSNTVMVVENLSNPVVWNQPDDLSPEQFLQLNLDEPASGATQILVTDGSVRRFKESEKSELQRMVSVDGR